MRIKVIKNIKKFSDKRSKELNKEFEIKNIISFENKNPKYSGMVIITNIECACKCEHHKVAVVGRIHIGYIPNKILLGLSQIVRIVEYFVNVSRETIQEKVTEEIIDFFWKKVKPQGVIIIFEASHQCITHRGVKQRNCSVITSSIRGIFKKQSIKDEFLKLVYK